jgi:hypothetical protein
MTTPEEQLALARAELRDAVAEGLLQTGRAQGAQEMTELIADVFAKSGAPLPVHVTGPFARRREANAKREEQVRRFAHVAESDDLQTMLNAVLEARELVKEAQEELLQAQSLYQEGTDGSEQPLT